MTSCHLPYQIELLNNYFACIISYHVKKYSELLFIEQYLTAVPESDQTVCYVYQIKTLDVLLVVLKGWLVL